MYVIPDERTPADLDRLDAWPVDLGRVTLGLSVGVWSEGSFPNRVIHVYSNLRAPAWDFRVPRWKAETKRHRFRFASTVHKVTGAALPQCLGYVDEAGGDWWGAACRAIAETTRQVRRRAGDVARADRGVT